MNGWVLLLPPVSAEWRPLPESLALQLPCREDVFLGVVIDLTEHGDCSNVDVQHGKRWVVAKL